MGWTSARLCKIMPRSQYQLIVYDRAQDKLVHKKASDFFDDEYSSSGTASYLALNCMDRVIRDADLHGFLWPLDRGAAAAESAKKTAAKS